MKAKFAACTLFLFLMLPVSAFPQILNSDSGTPQNTGSIWYNWEEKAADGFQDPLIHWHYYWKNGLFIESRKKNIFVKIGTKVGFDTGYIGPDGELDRAFPGLGGFDHRFRRLRVYTLMTFWNDLEFKFEIDFANLTDIKDIWVRYTGNSFLSHFLLGHVKEPFSLEEITSSCVTTFMERSLSTNGFAPGRDIGLIYSDVREDKRLTWAAGAFLVTGSFNDVGSGKDALTDPMGTALTGRVTGLLWYEGNGKKLFHLGLSYSHQFRNENRDNDQMQIKVRPETYLTDDRLVDTGKFHISNADFVNPEIALVMGPFSLQGEYFHQLTSSGEADDPDFWGFYFYGSYFITGEHRPYNTTKGIFSTVKPNQNFRFMQSGWGAWEAAFQVSFIDLNSGAIQGGKEMDFTAGLNWYLNPNMRFLFNYVRAEVSDRQNAPEISDGSADILQARFQVHF